MGQRRSEDTGVHTKPQQVASSHGVPATANICLRENCTTWGCGTLRLYHSTSGSHIRTCQAHAMVPHLGAGAGQALEDAYLLAKLLGHPQTNAKNVPVSAMLELGYLMPLLT